MGMCPCGYVTFRLRTIAYALMTFENSFIQRTKFNNNFYDNYSK